MELHDIQGLLVRGHGELPVAAYVMLQICDVKEARTWLGEWVDQVTPGDQKPHQRLQIVFTHHGLKKLGASQFVSHGFSVPFQQGMATDYRARILGDEGDSAETEWRWGGSLNPVIDLALFVFAADQAKLTQRLESLRSEYLVKGFKEVMVLHSQLNPHGKEHFGFRDGIGQPLLKGLKRTGPAENTVPLGEFVLGYENAYSQLPETPLVAPLHDPKNLLPTYVGGGGKDFGKNGSYLVFRQLVQDVAGFWQQIRNAVTHEDSTAGPDACIQLATKMVGRWPNGSPMALFPDAPPKEIKEPNDFLYAAKDPLGHGCPLGAHIRRSNPRDAMPNNKPDKSLTITKRHRILRRGRNFGAPLAPSFQPEDILNAENDGRERGLHFLCFNANISRQFEFIQHTWNNNTKFAGLYHDPDPILGIKDPVSHQIPQASNLSYSPSQDNILQKTQAATHNFTIQADPLRRKIRGLSRQVHMVGGAYFFMPGIKALRFLAHFQPES